MNTLSETLEPGEKIIVVRKGKITVWKAGGWSTVCIASDEKIIQDSNQPLITKGTEGA